MLGSTLYPTFLFFFSSLDASIISRSTRHTTPPSLLPVHFFPFALNIRFEVLTTPWHNPAPNPHHTRHRLKTLFPDGFFA
ncbi:hypothetical protein C8F04DRAFT_1143555 [Mycena alexandri]|uniref:Secreted protein n=1 Tax=Mycena alexandri TaxID=1745969 RepID=A0AAD6S5M8_9AGAR|nr:hypothetical protein C8F04DRAFT_1143555 [Mycena alexandri]